MTKVIITAALSAVLLAGPAIAASGDGYGMRRVDHGYNGRAMQRMPGQGFGTTGPADDPWRSGPYGDGNYPGNHDNYMRLPPSARGG